MARSPHPAMRQTITLMFWRSLTARPERNVDLICQLHCPDLTAGNLGRQAGAPEAQRFLNQTRQQPKFALFHLDHDVRPVDGPAASRIPTGNVLHGHVLISDAA